MNILLTTGARPTFVRHWAVAFPATVTTTFLVISIVGESRDIPADGQSAHACHRGWPRARFTRNDKVGHGAPEPWKCDLTLLRNNKRPLTAAQWTQSSPCVQLTHLDVRWQLASAPLLSYCSWRESVILWHLCTPASVTRADLEKPTVRRCGSKVTNKLKRRNSQCRRASGNG
jgi:hypothetical protein